MRIREATADDWEAIWPIFRGIVAAGETFSYDQDMAEHTARATWLLGPPGRTVVAVEDDGTVVGTAKAGPNHGGPAAHVATASFMVEPAHAGRGVGRALVEDALAWARDEGFEAMQFNAVVESNAPAVALWRSVGFEVLATIPNAFRHPTHGSVGLHVMHRRL